jgi:hypothetical protein
MKRSWKSKKVVYILVESHYKKPLLGESDKWAETRN